MLTQLRIQNFKSWRDTGAMRFAPLTGFFGPNSSGKSSVLQLLLLLKQTVESTDRRQVLNFGTERSYVNLSSFADIVFRHDPASAIAFNIEWTLPLTDSSNRPEPTKTTRSHTDKVRLAVTIINRQGFTKLQSFMYSFAQHRLGMLLEIDPDQKVDVGYEFYVDDQPIWTIVSDPNFSWTLPIKFYGFPTETNKHYSDSDLLSDLTWNFEQQIDKFFYLGPLREYPSRSYTWSGQWPGNLGSRGELTIQALLASQFINGKLGSTNGNPSQVETLVPRWLQALGLIHSFRLAQVTPNKNEYEVRLQLAPEAPEVLLTDVGFGLSQILPVLTLCYFVPEGSTIILEQPEIHLHPAIQSGLADVFIDVIKQRKVQIILESHSEHLLVRLQRRMAEEKLVPQDVALYFAHIDQGESKLDELHIDSYGNIRNWPQDFFGDDMGDLVAMTEAAMERQIANGASPA